MRFRQILITATLLAATAMPSWAATYYVAPEGATVSAVPDGTKTRPWPTVEKALSRAKGGDTILLMDGDHGMLRFDESFATDVTIQSETGKNAHITSAHFDPTAQHIRLSNLTVWREESDGPGFLVRAYKGSSYLTFEGLVMGSRKDAANHLKWDAARWIAVAGSGFDLRGDHYVVRNNTVTGVKVGIIAGWDALVENNVIDGFIGDGMKVLGESTIRQNLIMNRFKVDDWHADGIQAATKTVMRNLTLDSNTIIEWTHAPAHPLRGMLQGIGMFDGFYEDLLIENNVVVSRHTHGISVYGTRRAQIINNTVVNLTGKPGKYPMIRVKPHKDGTPSENVRVANNLAMGFEGGNAKYNNIFSDNSVIANPATVFENVAKFDYRPKATSGFIDRGNAAYASATDIRNMRRPYAKGPDKGAYEVGSTVSVPSTPSPLDIGKLLATQ